MFGRFIGPVRPVVPAVAGMMYMPAKKFFAINVVSAAGWAPFYLIPGILFGSSIGLASAIGSRLVIILVSIFLGAFLLVFITKKSMRFAMPRLEGWFDASIKWASKDVRWRKLIGALVDPDKNTKPAFTYLLLITALLVLFSITFVLSLWSPWLLRIDTVVTNVFVLLRTGPGDSIMWVIQNSFSWLILLMAILNILLGLYYLGLKKALYYFVALLGVSLLSSCFIVFTFEAINSFS